MSKINLQTVHFKASETLNQFITEKVEKLFKINIEIMRADVTLYEGASGNPQNQFCEIQLSVPGENIFVKKNSDSYEKSILKSVEAIQKILRRKKITKSQN